VVASIAAGNIISKTGRYRILAVSGAVLATIGMFLLAAMDGDTTRWEVVRNMVIAGLGIGIMQPIYTLIVQNVAPQAQMGAATASTQFFRSIGATVGVAVFGSVLLTMYHDRFQNDLPPGTPPGALVAFKEPLLLVQIRPQLDAAFAKIPGGPEILQKLLANVRVALVHGLHAIFLMGAILMVIAVIANLFLREVPLRKKVQA
jgi:MFS family permease